MLAALFACDRVWVFLHRDDCPCLEFMASKHAGGPADHGDDG